MSEITIGSSQAKIDLHRFCSDEELIPPLNKPWSERNFTYASQGHVLIRVPRLADVPENREAPRVSGTSLAKWFIIEPDNGWHTVPAVKVDMVRCPWCKGVGKFSDQCSCDDCDGTGKIVDDQGVEVGGIWFSNWLLDLISLLPGCEIGVNDEKNPSRLKFDGGEGLLMPRLWK